MRILVVEDDLALNAGLCFELDNNGYITVAAYNCRKAEQLIREDHFDLVLLDVCQKDTGFFFMPAVVATELVSAGRCSEMDILLDL